MHNLEWSSHTTCENMLGVKRMKKFFVVAALFVSFHFIGMAPANAQDVGPLEGITLEKAKQIALKQVKGKIIRTRVEKDDGKQKYEIIIQAKDGKYEVEIDKATGKVLEVEKEGSHKGNPHDGRKHDDHDDNGDHDDHDDYDDHDDSNDD